MAYALYRKGEKAKNYKKIAVFKRKRDAKEFAISEIPLKDNYRIRKVKDL